MMPKTERCPNCGYEFEEGLEDKGYSYTEVMDQVEGLLKEGQTIDPEVVSRQYGKSRLEISDMVKKIRKKNPDKILRPIRQGQFKFLTDLVDISNAADKRQRNIWGQDKILTQDRLRQVALLEKTKDPEMLRQAAEIRERFYITGDLLDEPRRAKRLPSGLFQVINGDGAKET